MLDFLTTQVKRTHQTTPSGGIERHRDPIFRGGKTCFTMGVLIFCSFLVFGKAVNYDYVRFDDDAYIYENPHVKQGLTTETILWALTADLAQDDRYSDYFQPVTLLSRLVESSLFGVNPSASHAANLFLHLLNGFLLFLALARTTRTRWPPLMTSALFLLHPLQVEPVVWATARKDLLSTFFLLLTIHAYFNFVRSRRPAAYLTLVIAFIASLASKPSSVYLPLLLIFLDYWPLNLLKMDQAVRGIRRYRLKDPLSKLIVDKVPLLIVSCIFVYLLQRQFPAIASSDLADKAVYAPILVAVYLHKIFVPFGLAVHYPAPEPVLSMHFTTGSVLLIITITAFVFKSRLPSRRPVIVGWLWFLITIAPYLGAVETLTTDRYTYVPLIGIAILAVWMSDDLVALKHISQRAALLATISVLIVCAGTAAVQVTYWQSTEKLFQRAVLVSPESALAQHNLGLELYAKGQLDGAYSHLKSAAGLRPSSAVYQNGYAAVAQQLGRKEEAGSAYLIALSLEPNNAFINCNYGHFLATEGDTVGAELFLKKAVSLAPDNANAAFLLNALYEQRGEWRKR